MALATYADLKASLASWSNRSDLTAVIPDFVAYAQELIASNLRSAAFLKRATVSITAEYEAVPADFVAPSSLYLDQTPRVEVAFITAEARASLAVQYSSAPFPRWAAVEGANFAFAPAFTGTASGSLLYWPTIPALVLDDDTNAVLTRYPFLYLWGGLSALFSFLEDEQRADRWEQKFRGLILDINKTDRNDATRAPLQTVPYQGGIV